METIQPQQEHKTPAQAYEELLAKGLYEEAEVLKHATGRLDMSVADALITIALIDEAASGRHDASSLCDIYFDVVDTARVYAEAVINDGSGAVFGAHATTYGEARERMVKHAAATFKITNHCEAITDLLLQAAIAQRSRQE